MNKQRNHIDKSGKLPTWKKIVYGSGDWGLSSFGTIRQIFYAIFLTDVVGLDARLASIGALIGIIWDAINDPLIGTFSDRVKTKWGRRRPFLLFFAIPFGLGFIALWWAPPWNNQWLLLLHVMAAYMLSDTFQTLISVPFYALTPEISKDYDERTSVTSYRMFFNLLASLVVAVCAPYIVDMSLQNGSSLQQGYLIVGALFGGLAIIPFFIIFFIIKEQPDLSEEQPEISFMETLHTAWENIPFRFATGIYMLNWITFDLVALMLPYFLIYWVSKGNLLASVSIAGLDLPLESIVLGSLLITALLAIPIWDWAAKRFGKRYAYIFGMSFWAVVQTLIIFIQPGQISFIIILSVLAGISVSTAHILPEAIFPDVIEWDELRTGQRHEGIYYGIKNFIRKMTGAIAIFMALQVIGWFNYQTPPGNVTQFTQSPITLLAIRYLTGPVGAILLLSAITLTWFYPLTKEKHHRIRRLLEKRVSR